MEKEKVYHGAIIILHKTVERKQLYAVVENSETGNITFISGAQEEEDSSIKDTAFREIGEELKGIDVEQIDLVSTGVKHKFEFGAKKKERKGVKGSYEVFTADVSSLGDEIKPTEELKSVKWMTEEEALESLTFPDLKEVFEEVIKT